MVSVVGKNSNFVPLNFCKNINIILQKIIFKKNITQDCHLSQLPHNKTDGIKPRRRRVIKVWHQQHLAEIKELCGKQINLTTVESCRILMQLEQGICQEHLNEENTFLMHFDGKKGIRPRPQYSATHNACAAWRCLLKAQFNRNESAVNIFEPVEYSPLWVDTAVTCFVSIQSV